MNRIEIKKAASRLIKENWRYYVALALVPSLLIVFQLGGIVVSIARALQTVLDLAAQNALTTSNVMQWAETSSNSDTLTNFILTTVFTLLTMSLRMVLLTSYRNQNSEKHSGIKDIFYIFGQNRWIPAVFLIILNTIYMSVVTILLAIVYAFIAVFLILPIMMIDNTIIAIISSIILLLLTIVFVLVVIICRNFTSQMTYLLLDGYQKETSFVSAFTISFKLMTQKYNLKQYLMLQASFILWSILNILTLGISGLLWSNAYIEMSYAAFYEDLLNK
ncbi:DUF975 family protein [Holzapfeliella sp. He02]|uniref:DUF975 family protein n=1 Tax=Holzapfeliella saturejae TaxID=3082953 RepID=A0ABU8SH72_9LACO